MRLSQYLHRLMHCGGVHTMGMGLSVHLQVCDPSNLPSFARFSRLP